MLRGPDAPSLADGRYTLTRRLGEGGMATVFLGWDNKLKVWRAIKVLLPSIVSQEKLRKRFENEAHAMARLEHPNIIRVYDVGSEAGVPYIVMELAEGGCVIDWLQRYGAMPPRLAVDVTVQLCRGIQAAHEAGIVHRDIKPHNILVNRKGVCKVTDFGIAQVSDKQSLTKTGSVMGTWGYMAPEQRTDAKAVDERADVFAIGATLYTLLTQRTPAELYVADVDDEMFAGIPAELLDVILRACRYKPADRHPDAHALGKDVHRAGQNQPPVPISTPSLVLATDPLPESVESAPLSPTIVRELQRALGKDGVSDPGVAPAPAATPVAERRVLPYYMPAKQQSQPAPIESHLPRYLDPEVAKRERAEELARTPAPAQPAPPRPEPAPAGSGDLLLKLAVVPLTALFVLIVTTGIGTVMVGGAQGRATEATEALYQVLANQAALVDGLQKAGADRMALEALYFDFVDAPPAERPARALDYIEAVEKIAAERADDPAIPPIRSFLVDLARARDAWVTEHAAWSDTAAGFPGNLAVGVGLARAPTSSPAPGVPE